MNITITNAKKQYKANDGGATRRIPEHFVKRTVFFEVDGEERRIFIDKADLPIGATEDEIIAYIEANFDDSSITNEQLKELQNTVDMLVLDNLMNGGNE